jgi:hypothetical protein
MWNTPNQERLDRIPKLYETEETPLEDKLIHLHLFIGGCDWFVVEFDGNDLFWGFACLNDIQNAEWGYISLSELKSINISGIEIDCELEIHWNPRPAGQIEKICQGMGWSGKEKQHGIHTDIKLRA